MDFRHIDASLAENLIKAVFACQSAEGFVPHSTGIDMHSTITHPPIIAFSALKVYEKSRNNEFPHEIFEKNVLFLRWCESHRRKSEKQLYTWHRSEDKLCRCDESGMDNSPRFDTASELYMPLIFPALWQTIRCIARIADILGFQAKANAYLSKYSVISEEITKTLWSEADGFYYDYDIDNGRLHTVSSVASFLPLFCGICNENQAAHLADALTDQNQYGTAFPIPNISRSYYGFGDDMWRGPVWINCNYMISEGLRAYGYTGLAEEI